MKRFPIPTILICVTGFLLPILGGYLSLDTGLLSPNTSLLPAIVEGLPVPILSHLVATLPLIAAIAWIFTSRRVAQVPSIKVTIWLALLLGLILISVLVSRYRAISLPVALEWFGYGIAFFGCCAGLGRSGAKHLCYAIIGGTSIAAIVALREYGAMRTIDPNWRVFGTFNNPNALGPMLVTGWILAIANFSGTERLGRLAILGAILLTGLALILTQSKGSLLVVPVGVATLCISRWVLDPRSAVKEIGVALALSATIVALGLGLRARPAVASTGSSALSRIGNSSEATEQSAGFRNLLWRGTLTIIGRQPIGVGIGAYRYYSTQAGLTTQTTLAHQSYLQLASEATVLAPTALFGFVISVVAVAARGIRQVSPERKTTFASILAALASLGAHNFIDSDFYTYALGMTPFMLMGALITVGPDAYSPEFIFRSVRTVVLSSCAVWVLAMTWVGLNEADRATARGYLATRDFAGARSAFESALSKVPFDGAAFAGLATLSNTPAEAIRHQQAAVQFAPTPKNYRALAILYERQGRDDLALAALDGALSSDPKNLNALYRAFRIRLENNQPEEARKLLDRMKSIEASEYFRVRSQPDIVPTETFEARLDLAPTIRNESERAALLKEAVEGLTAFAARTAPLVLQNTNESSPEYAGISRQEAQALIRRALDAATTLRRISTASAELSQFATDARAGFEEALAKFDK